MLVSNRRDYELEYLDYWHKVWFWVRPSSLALNETDNKLMTGQTSEHKELSSKYTHLSFHLLFLLQLLHEQNNCSLTVGQESITNVTIL